MRSFDLAIIGSGSGNSIIDDRFADQSVALFEHGKFGGTCLNAGCIPSKMFEYPAELAFGARTAEPLGVDATVQKVHWAAMRDRIFGRIDAIEAGGREYRTGPRTPNITTFTTTATFVGPKTLSFRNDAGDDETITADKIVVAAGSRVSLPRIPGLADVDYQTSDSIMRIDDLPASIVIVGGGYIAAEFAHVFASFGTRVIQVARSHQLLKTMDRDLADRFTEVVADRYELRCGANLSRVETRPDGIAVTIKDADGETTEVVGQLLIATGRRPNSDVVHATDGGLAVHHDHRIVVDEYQRTSVPGVFALGDISSQWQLKHVANTEARTVQHNLLHPDQMVRTDHRFVPAAVFTHPQIATVGLTEDQVRERGLRYVVKQQTYGDIAAGWAREDTTGFAKIIADPATGLILGAHLIGPEAATVIQPIIQAMSFGQSARDLARGQYWIHPALPELLENALLGLELDELETS